MFFNYFISTEYICLYMCTLNILTYYDSLMSIFYFVNVIFSRSLRCYFLNHTRLTMPVMVFVIFFDFIKFACRTVQICFGTIIWINENKADKSFYAIICLQSNIFNTIWRFCFWKLTTRDTYMKLKKHNAMPIFQCKCI